MDFSFARPFYLTFLVLIPLLVLIHFYSLKQKRVSALKFANFQAIARVKGIDLISKNITVLVLTSLISVLLIFSLSGLTIHRQLNADTFSYVIAIDASRSMEATDFLPTRLDAAKETAIDFVNSLPSGTKVGVISFAGVAFIETDLTKDKLVSKQAIQQISTNALGGTDIYEAVLTSDNLLRGEDAKAIILLSDGQINVGTVDNVVAFLSSKDIVVSTLGMGTAEGGQTSYGMSKLDEESLKSIAYATGGKYFSAKNRQELKNSFTQIQDLKFKRTSHDISSYLALAALALLVLEYLLINTRYKILP